MTFVLGLTGSIGMGKTTTARMFAEEGLPVWDADATVHKLYSPGGAAAAQIQIALPDAIAKDGSVSRERLKALIREDPTVLDQLNAIVHPLVAADRVAFLEGATSDVVVLDIPLLFETGADTLCDATLVVTAPPEVQRTRVLERGEMTEDDFRLILSRQMPDPEKRARADFIVETLTLDGARTQVRDIITTIRERLTHA
jgi:dephospho-CoA kinase